MKLTLTYPIILMGGLLGSCTVMNNLYVSDPEPLGKGNLEFHLGGSSGLRPEVDGINTDGDIIFSGKVNFAPNFNIGGQYGISRKINLRYAAHLPYVLGGFGLRAGPQYSFFDQDSKFNMALGADGGFVIAKDSLRFLGSGIELDIQSNGSLNADLYLPLSIKLGENTRLILTPRYSFTTLYIRHNENYRGTWKYRIQSPSISLGLRLKRVHLETTLAYIQEEYYPTFGLVYFLNVDQE